MADAPAKFLEALMHVESQTLSVEYQLELYSWAAAWYKEVVDAGFIDPAFEADDETVRRLRGYFDAGLSPFEAAQAIFGDKH